MDEEEEEEEEEEEGPEYEGIGRNNFENTDFLYEDQARKHPVNDYPDISGEGDHKVQAPIPSEPRPLYEVLQEVKTSVKTGEIYSSNHGYAIPS